MKQITSNCFQFLQEEELPSYLKWLNTFHQLIKIELSEELLYVHLVMCVFIDVCVV